ncbi:filamentous hemagglutinin N-terminal domain-containing protein, partial [Salmonella enterica]|nr:filamentous hemagglutinin N-terminal domain-containing protein [Salmonella enterica]EJG3990375.1 filamentous hemagglutinin N-terminal domain-containing protein [Salmonella enterica]
MNKIYKLKYDRRRNQLVAVSELTTGAGKEATGSVAGLCGLQGVSTFRRLMGTLTPLAVLTGLVIGMLPGLALANPDLPVGGQVVAGQGSISTSGNQMTIHQGTHGLVTNWHSFDIGQNHTVQFVQPDSSAVALNRVTGGHESQILGTLTANGQVMLVNPAGVMFGKGAKVNTAGLLASTKNISTEDFMAGRYTFSGGSHPGAEIVNQGSLTTTKGGYIVLAADRVRNSGAISTPSGKTVLAAADRVTLQLDNTGLASVSVNGSVVNALVENSGLIAATNGQVYLTARGKEMLLNTVVNNSGTVEARGLNQLGGEIVLDGGESGVVSQSGMLLADSETGRGGKITVQGANIHLAGGSRTSATGRTGGGEVYVGGGWQGKDAAIRNASKVVMDRDAVIDVSATEKGDGGKAVLWSEDYTNFRGLILAKGGAQSGNGGQVETSSLHNLQAFGDVDASAVRGGTGNWLLDPEDITITGSGSDTGVTEGANSDGIFTPSSSGSTVTSTTINNRLNSGTSVTIKTTKADDNSNLWGNITVNTSINHTATNNVSLTLEADGNINITGNNITSTNGMLNVNLLGAGNHNGTITLNHANITTNGGNITLGQWVETNDGTVNTNKLGISITNVSVLNAAAAHNPSASTNGNITLTANNNTTLSGPILKGNNITLNVSNATGNALTINNYSNLTADTNLILNGTSVSGVGVYLSSSHLSGGNVTVTGTSGKNSGKGLEVAGNISLTATAGNLNLTGRMNGSGGGFGAHIHGNNTFTATENITVNGSAVDGSNGGLNLNRGTFSAENTVLNGQSDQNYIGVKAGSCITVTKGNLSITGTANRINSTSSVTGLMSDGTLVINVSSGHLNITGKVNDTGHNAASAGTSTGLNLSKTTLNALTANLTGVSMDAGQGFTLNNVTLNGNIAQGNNMSFSSQGSGANVTNTLNVNGGLEYDVFKKMQQGGIDNNTSVLVTTTTEDLKNMGLSSTGWTYDASQAGIAANGKAGTWELSFLNIAACVSGNISLTGMSLVNSNLTGSGVTLQGANNASLTLQNITLNATSGNVSLSANGSINLSVGNIGASQGSVNVQAGGVNGTEGGDALTVSSVGFSSKNGTTLNGQSAQNGAGVKMNGTINVTQGNLTVNGTTTRVNNATDVRGIDARNTNINVSQTNAVLNMTGTVKGDIDAAQTQSVVGLDLSGNSTVLNSSSANLTGVSTAKGMGFILNASLSDSLKSTSTNNLTLHSTGSDDAVHNYIGTRVDDDFIGHLIDTNTSIDNKTEVQKVDVYKTQLQKYIDENKNSADLTKNFGDWILSFTGINVSKTGNISFTGAEFSNSNLTAGGNLTLDNGPGNLSLNGSILNSTNGYVNLTGGSGINLKNGNISAKDDITINASNGGVTISGVNKTDSGRGNITSTEGNISIYGNALGVPVHGVSLGNVNVNATGGTVNVVAEGSGGASALAVSGDVSFKAINTSVVANNTVNTGGGGAAGIYVDHGVSLTFEGNSAILAHSVSDSGILLSPAVADSSYNKINVINGTLNITASTDAVRDNELYGVGGITVSNYYVPAQVEFDLLNASLNINASASATDGKINAFAGYSQATYGYVNPFIFKGQGNVSVTGMSQNGVGISSRYFDNTNLNGNLSLKGVSVSGNGIEMAGQLNMHLVNATLQGESTNGGGIVIASGSKGDLNLNGNTLTGTSDTGVGINISGNNVTITNGTLNGTSNGSDAGVQLTGGTNYTVGNATVQGASQAGSGVSMGGNLSVSNATVNGSTVTGSGVDIGGDLNAVNTAFTGNASGKGNGVSLHGNITGDAANQNVITGHAS